MILRHFYHYGSIFFVISAITKVSQFVNISHKSLVRYLYTNRPLDYLFIQFSCLFLNALFSKALFVVWYYNLYDDLVFIADLFGFQFTSLDQRSYKTSIYSWIARTAFIHMSSINSTELPKTQFSWIKHFYKLRLYGYKPYSNFTLRRYFSQVHASSLLHFARTFVSFSSVWLHDRARRNRLQWRIWIKWTLCFP